MYAQQIGDEIVLERAEPDRLERWIFHDVRRDSFAWRKDTSIDGRPWQTRQTVLARRASTLGAAGVS